MAKFSPGDVVIRSYPFIDPTGRKCHTGSPVTVVYCDETHIEFSEEEGGGGWDPEFFVTFRSMSDPQQTISVDAAIKALTSAGYRVTIEKV